MGEKPKYHLSVGSAWFVDDDGNRIPIGSASLQLIPSEPEGEPDTTINTSDIADLGSFTWTFKSVSRETFDQLLRVVDPREWWRRHWWKLPALWRRGE